MADARLMVEEIAKALVHEPDQVEVREVMESQGIVLELFVAEDDLGRIIGKQGRTARSIRTLLSMVGTRFQRRYQLEIVE